MNYSLNVLFANQDQSLLAVVPNKQLLDQSLHVVAPNKKFNSWSHQNHVDSYLFMQRIAQVWKRCKGIHQYLIYGKINSNSFKWEMVPYQKCRTWIGRIVQQLQVLWRTIFGGFTVSKKSVQNQTQRYKELLEQLPEIERPLDVVSKGNDSFCKHETINLQCVVKGRTVYVLFNFAPLGFGGERLHFLVVTKEHRKNFNHVTQEEYCESLELTTKLVDYFIQTRKTIKNVYILNKTGIDAGQTVEHWHLHVIFSTNAAQDFWGKMTVFKNIFLGSSPMKKDCLTKTVDALRKELNSLV